MKIVSTQEMHGKLLSPKILQAGFAFMAVVLLIGAGIFAYIWFSGGSGNASVPVAAPKLAITDNAKLFRIQPSESQVRFIIDEVLIGQPKTVIGSTQEVAGDIAIDFNAPQQSKIGAIRDNVKTLSTDNEFRNRALRGQILEATRLEFEFASFTPKQMIGLPDSITLGQPFSFQIIGDLTLHGVTHEVQFEATVTPVNQTMIKGTAKAEIRYTNFGLSIPEAPGVANVSENVRLEIDLTATQTDA